MSDEPKTTGDVITAPFTDEQVEGLNDWQRCGRVHPFTCGQRDDHQSEGVLVATNAGWVCDEPGCDYTQDWAHAFMVEPVPAWPWGSVVSPVEPHRATITVEWSPDTPEDDTAAIAATLAVACDELVEALYHDAVSVALVNHSDQHRYISTACLHGHHTLCRRQCKYCPASCACTGCDHTGIEDRPGRELHRGPTGPLATGEPGSLVTAVVDHPPGATVVVYAAADPSVCPSCARGDHNGCDGCRCGERDHYGLDTNALGHKETPDA